MRVSIYFVNVFLKELFLASFFRGNYIKFIVNMNLEKVVRRESKIQCGRNSDIHNVLR